MLRACLGLPLLAIGCAKLSADPIEPLNRATSSLNGGLTSLIGGGNAGSSTEGDLGGLAVISNIATNLREPLNFTNALLQGRECAAGVSLRRFLTNTTLGVGGLFDVARSSGGLQPYNTDFGETMGIWGVPSGGYLVLPLLGPTNVRGVVGTGIEFVADPVNIPLAKVGIPAADWAVIGVSVAGNVIDASDTTAVSNIAADPYTIEKAAFEKAEAERLAGYDCPSALNSLFWSSQPP